MELFFLILLIMIMVGALGSGYPVAFALPGSAIITITIAAAAGYFFAGDSSAYFHSSGPWEWLTAGVTNLRGVYWEVERDTLIAIPLFIFMGIMLQRSKIAEDLLVTMAQLFGPVPGGLGISVVFVGALLAATTGIVGATVVAMGMISLPAMLRNNYSPALSTGSIAASGTLGQIIPPSVVLIILADQLGSASDQASTARKELYKQATGEFTMPSAFDVASTSAGEMFLGALIPGLFLVGLYMLYILGYALLKPDAAPPVPFDGNKDRTFWLRVGITLFAPLTLILLVLGSIISGVATVNQAGAIGASGAILMAGYRLVDAGRRTFIPVILGLTGLGIITFAQMTFDLNLKSVLATDGSLTGIVIGILGVTMVITALVWSGVRVYHTEKALNYVMVETAKTTSLVFIILLGAAILTSAFRAFGGEDIVREFLNSLPGGFWVKFIIVMAVIFFLGFFLDFIEIAVVVVPIVAPILLSDPSANITAVWLGVMIGLNMQTSFLTPPFGFALFYLRGVASSVIRTVEIYRGVIPFILLQLVALGIAGYAPQIVNYLPNRVSFLSETAPPPRNPRLELCLTNYITEQVTQNGERINAQIATAREMDLSFLPDNLERRLGQAFVSADDAVLQLGAIVTANNEVMEAAPAYRPVQHRVRDFQAEARQLTREIEELETDLSRVSPEEGGVEISAKIAALEGKHKAVLAQIPESWPETYATFNALIDEETNARRLYKRLSREAFDAPSTLFNMLRANPEFRALEGELTGLRGVIETDSDAREKVDALGRAFAKLDGTGDVKSLLSRVERALKPGKIDRDEALEEYAKAVDVYRHELAWRSAAEEAFFTVLSGYVDTISDTISAQHQQSLTRNQALFLASCSAQHRDVSLHF